MMFKKASLALGFVLAILMVTPLKAATVLTPSCLDPENQTVAPPVLNLKKRESFLPPQAALQSADALSGYNRLVFRFNDTLDRTILKPLASLYNKLIPRPLHQGISNVFNNIDNLPTVLNDLLQLKFYHAASDAWRLVINTTVGIGGLFDVGSRLGLKPHHEDFGLTLARWGYKHSNYFVVPLFGPGTIRDILGWPVDYFFFSIYPYIEDTKLRYAVYGLGVIDRRANLLQYQDVFEQVAVDRYSFMRDAYLQHRKYQIEEDSASSEDLTDPGSFSSTGSESSISLNKTSMPN